MATAEQLKALLRSYSEADGEQFLSVALQIAAHAARTGKTKLADELKVLVQDVRRKQSTQRVGGAVPIVQPNGELAKLLTVTYPERPVERNGPFARHQETTQQGHAGI